jgi:hypothetical protein
MKGCPVVVATIVVGALLASCSHERGTQCGDDSRYTRARTAAPVRIPDDLTPPDETDSLRLPQGTRQASAADADADANGRCLETPPKFGEAGAGRARSAQTPASGQARPATGAPAAPPAEPTPAGGDREIGN